jgi:putative glycosyltransferase
MISIIIPVYNVERYLRECLDSVLTLHDFEAILVDDGSTDASGKICDEYVRTDPRFKVIHQPNSGVSKARNVGLDAARGEWIWFVDSDDVVDVRCATQIQQWLNRHNDTDYVMFDLKKFDDGDVHVMDSFFRQYKEVDILQEKSKNDFLLKYVCAYHCTLWYRREVVEKYNIRFTIGIRNSEDGEFMAKYLMVMQHPVKVDFPIYYYRMREGSAMHLANAKKNIIDDVPVVFFNLLKWMDKVGISTESWLNYWFMKMIQNLLVNASQYPQLDRREFQNTVGKMLQACKDKGFTFVYGKKMRLAGWNVSVYFLVNKLYLKLKGI